MGKWFDDRFKHFAVGALSLLAKTGFGARRIVEDEPEPGSLILCNHTCVFDFAFLLFALRPRTDIRFVATGVQFDKSRFKRWAFGHLEVIRKEQGTQDARCVREIIRTVRGGKVAALYAAGMTSYDGREAWDAMPGTGSLAHMLKCPVYTAITSGGFLSHPRFAGRTCRGRVEIRVKRILTAEESTALSADEIQARMNEALRFNDWDWQTRTPHAFRGMKDMTGVTNTLYRCPDCGREGTLDGAKGHIVCSACGMDAVRDRYGFFSSVKGNCPSRMDVWTDGELETLREELKKEDFCLRETVTMQEGNGGEYADSDEGTLRLTKQELIFSGKKQDEHIGLKEFQFMILNDRDHIQINLPSRSLRFVFKNTRLITKWFFAHRMMMQND